jgi:ABC-type glycerol-3-phosphate transport system permease component
MTIYFNTWIVIFVAVYIINYYFVLKPKLKEKKETMETNYLKGRFQLDKKILYNEYTFKRIGIINSLIISFTSTVLIFLKLHLSLLFLIGFVLLNGLIFSLYELFGKHLKKKASRYHGL